MKALLLEEYNKLVIIERPDPEPAPDEVLIRVRAVGICGSDVHGMDGSTGRRIPPVVMGHEAAGIVIQPGSEVSGIDPNQRVTFDSTIYCGKCACCESGNVNLCEHRKVFGVSCDEYCQDGACAEYVTVPARGIYKIPDKVSFEQAACVEPLSVALHAVNRAGSVPGGPAVVFGAGMIGILIVQVLKARGVEQVWAVDVNQERLALAAELGADKTFDPRETDIAAETRKLTGGGGAALSFDAVGVDETLAAAVTCLAKQGTCVLVGNFRPVAGLPLQRAVVREITIRGSCASAGEYPECLELLESGKVRVDPLISAVAPLEEGPSWFKRLYDGEPGLFKVILRP
ncbi:MAG: galactitol-1-phosphate 5-dehydrogenase [Candidatus Glassbacteria bacterium]|nr:galactitol-1-phosphate 5-dehydrogenase [Candidatus Glassbacteria bacterium]